MTHTGDHLPTAAIGYAQQLAAVVHDGDAADVARILDRQSRTDLYALAVTLAAMLPVDYSPSELLAWNDSRFPTTREKPTKRTTGRALSPHGTHAAFNLHKAWRETPCEVCVFGERNYQRDRRRRSRGTVVVVDEAVA